MDTVAQLVISGVLLGGIYATITVGLTLIFGVLRLVNFAHGEILMFSMYGAYWAFTLLGMSPYWALPLVALAAGLFGAILYKLVIGRTVDAPHVVQVFSTVGLSIALQNLALMLWQGDFRSIRWEWAQTVVQVGPVTMGGPRLVAFGVSLIAAGAIFWILYRTELGLAIRATAQNRRVAQLMGIDVDRVYLAAYALGLACVGVAGPLLMPLYYVSPSVGLQFVLISFVVAVIGGLGNLGGAILGGLLIGIVETLSGFLIGSGWQQAVYFVLFLVVLILRPAGLFGLRGAEEFDA